MCSLTSHSPVVTTVTDLDRHVSKCRFCDSQFSPQPTLRASFVRSSNFSDSGWRKYLSVVLLGISFLLLPSTTMSNPVPSGSGDGAPTAHHRHHTRGHEREQKWINPCRIPSALPTFSPGSEVTPQSDEEILRNIYVQAKKAEDHSLGFRTDFYKEAFGGDPLDRRFEGVTYDFLTDVMTQVNAGHSDEQLSTLDLDETIRFLYHGLQKFAVGLEAIVLDQACYGGSFYHHFNEAEFQLKYVLCELQIAMLEKNISHQDITREIMSTQYRDVADKTTRNLRDWTIFRDYVKTLDYVRHVLVYFQRARNSVSS